MAAGPALATKVKGSVDGFRDLVNPVWHEARDPARHLYSFREPVPTVRSEFRALFPHIPKELCIAAISTEAQKPPKPILIRVGGGRTTPVTIVVTPGTELQFQNTDPFTHRLYGVGIPTFQPNDTMKGGIRGFSVTAPGTFEIRDEAAPSVRMWIVAEPRVAAIAYPSMKGDFVLTVEAAGTYDVVAYFAGKKIGTPQKVEIAAKDIGLDKPLVVAEKGKTKKEEGE